MWSSPITPPAQGEGLFVIYRIQKLREPEIAIKNLQTGGDRRTASATLFCHHTSTDYCLRTYPHSATSLPQVSIISHSCSGVGDEGPTCLNKTVGTALDLRQLWPAPRPHHSTCVSSPNPAISTLPGNRVYHAALQPLLARKRLSESCLGWEEMSNSANCGAGRRSWEKAAERKIIS